jgi:transcriptional regulator with XRE-family HTH domain
MVMTVSEQLGRRVRELRTAAGFSQEAMAARAGLDRSFYGRVERGTQNVALPTLARLSVALGITLSDLFSGVEVDHCTLGALPRRGAGGRGSRVSP